MGLRRDERDARDVEKVARREPAHLLGEVVERVEQAAPVVADGVYSDARKLDRARDAGRAGADDGYGFGHGGDSTAGARRGLDRLSSVTAMPSAQYRFVTEWDVVGTAREVSDVLADPLELSRWWPSVYLAVAELEPGGEGGVGRRVVLLTKGWLPYTLSWSFRVVESRHPHGFTLEAEGDFVGRGVWTFDERGAWVHVDVRLADRGEKAAAAPSLAPGPSGFRRKPPLGDAAG